MEESRPIALSDADAIPGAALLRRFLEGSYLYILSALAMIAGCYLLMRTTPAAGGEFLAVLRGLAILQGYEVALILTAALIVRRLGRLDDAFTLLAIELTLLLDPTFFVNNFHTLMQSDRATPMGIHANAACFALVVAKLALLQAVLRIRLSGRAFAAFVLTAAIVYLAPRWLAVKEATLERHAYFFVLTWLMPMLALAMPARDAVLARVRSGEFLTPAQKRHLPGLFLAVPALLLPLHLGESWYVHNLTFYGVYLSPLFVAVALRLALQRTNAERVWPRMFAVDLLAAVALVAALPQVQMSWREVHNTPAPWLNGIAPLAVVGAVVAAVYAIFFLVHGYRPALARVLLLAGAAATMLALRHGALGIASRHPAVPAGLMWVACFAIWLRWRHAATELLLGAATLAVLWMLPVNPSRYFWEYAQGAALVVLALYHRHGGSRTDRLVMALVLVSLGCWRCVVAPGTLTTAVAGAEVLGLALIGWLASERRYTMVAGLQAAAVVVILARPTAGMALVAAGVLLFAAGVWVTFRRERLLRALTPPPVALDPRPDSAESR